MPQEIDEMNGDRHIRDQRKWYVSKEIPVALIISMAGGLFLGGVAYQSLKGEVATTNADVKQIKQDLRTLAERFAESAVPSEQARWRIEQAERQATELRTAVSANTTAITDINRRLSIVELRTNRGREP